MNEPLSNSLPRKSLVGKAYNKHPQWYNEPLRLTKEQNRDPIIVFNDFFQSYHLNETRIILWQWLTAVISSPGNISFEAVDRSSHLYFYEKIQEFIEAGFILQKRIQKHRRKREKRKLKEANNISCGQNSDFKETVIKAELSQQEASEHIEEIINKEKRLIEYAVEAPLYVIHEVFTTQGEFTSSQLRADCNSYETSEDREQLKNFHDDLLTLIDALYIIFSNNVEKLEGQKPNPFIYQVSVLSEDQISNPEKVISAFFKKYPRAYIDRELEDWLESAICYSGKWPNDLFCHAQLLDVHRSVLCLIKSAEKLLSCKDFTIGIS